MQVVVEVEIQQILHLLEQVVQAVEVMVQKLELVQQVLLIPVAVVAVEDLLHLEVLVVLAW
jgi:hypothetical protein